MSIHPLYPLPVTAALLCLLALAVAWVWLRRPHRSAAWRRSLIALGLAVLLLGPSAPLNRQRVTSSLEIYFVVDTTGSMVAEDYNGSSPRLDGVRADLAAIADHFPEARYSIISYAAEAVQQMPLTTDQGAVKSWADTVRQERSYLSDGSAAARPVRKLTQILKQARESRPDNRRLIFLFTDGEVTNTESDQSDPAAFSQLRNLIDGGAVLGYGTEAGGKMKENLRTEKQNESHQYLRDYSTGRTAISHADPQTLAAIAEEMRIPYEHRSSPSELTAVFDQIPPSVIVPDETRDVPVDTVVVWPVMVLLVALFGWELAVLIRQLKLARSTPRGGANAV